MKGLKLKALLSLAVSVMMLLIFAVTPVFAQDPPDVPSPANPTAPPQGVPPYGPPDGTPPENRPGAHPHDPFCSIGTICGEAEWEPGECWTVYGHVWDTEAYCNSTWFSYTFFCLIDWPNCYAQ